MCVRDARGAKLAHNTWALTGSLNQGNDHELVYPERNKRSPFWPGNPFEDLGQLFAQAGRENWQPNVPYVFVERGQAGLTSTGAIPSHSGWDPNAIRYDENGIGIMK